MELKRAFDFINYQLEQYPRTDALNGKLDGKWINYSTQQVIDIANRLSIGLLKLGIKKGDKVAIVAGNRPEWNLLDIATQQIGVINVPMYPTISIADYEYIFNDSKAKIAFVANQDLHDKVKQATAKLDVAVYTFDKLPKTRHWTEVEDLGKNEDMKQLEAHRASVKENDLLTLIYTSGTTGVPKGVMLTHKNVVSNVLAVGKGLIDMAQAMNYKIGYTKAVSFLPLCHIYERTASVMYWYLGCAIYYAESMETIVPTIQEIKPDNFTAVPRIFEKLYNGIVAKGMELKGMKKSIFFWALKLGEQYEPNKDLGWWYNKQLEIANKLVFSKWRAALGGNIKYVNSGAAALQPRLCRVFWAAGIKIYEGYGLTETSPVITSSMTTDDKVRIGCVGEVIDGVQVKIAEDGEILCKGNNVMLGYYNQPELTDQVLKDGWFHTGDIGELVEGKYLKITDRKKEIFKTSGGKYIAPQMMENSLKESPFIEQIIVIGENKNFPSALIVPAFDQLKKWCEHKVITYTTPEEMIKNPRVIEKFDEEIKKINEKFGNWEKVKKFTLLSAPWGIDSGELTPTLKLKRKSIYSKYEKIIDEIYS
ncbi:MAG: long-chain fatty acid--CoA ligase [Cytophagales bacterium]|nr:MAG: long-chain fatty acid--CoA ligase [Cytophagales bacterium]